MHTRRPGALPLRSLPVPFEKFAVSYQHLSQILLHNHRNPHNRQDSAPQNPSVPINPSPCCLDAAPPQLIRSLFLEQDPIESPMIRGLVKAYETLATGSFSPVAHPKWSNEIPDFNRLFSHCFTFNTRCRAGSQAPSGPWRRRITGPRHLCRPIQRSSLLPAHAPV